MSRLYWTKTDVERFMSYVRQEPNGCWIWTGHIEKHRGYGVFTVRSRPIVAHRWAYQQWVGVIPSGYDVCHHCDVRPCVNPTHLFAGTRADNMQDAARKGRTTAGERSPQAKLTATQVAYIRSVPEKWGVVTHLARTFGVSHSLIWGIRKGKRWRHLLEVAS
jgi:hypothetical protein